MFRPEDMEALRAIQILVHQRGLTLKGQGVGTVLSGNARLVGVEPAPAQSVVSAPSPARDLQKAVSQAFGTSLPAEGAQATGSTERLQSVLVEMSDLKRRLDALRVKHAA